jgi:uncharacterized membrane protein
MLLITLQYIPVRRDVAFLYIKEAAAYDWYQVIFYTHVLTSMAALVAGFTQFSTRLRKRWPRVHRSVGKLYVGVVLFASGPTGLVMGVLSEGGWVAKTAFILLAGLWLLFTAKAFQSATRKRFAEHRDWMIRSYALTLSAVTLRAWKWVIVALFAPAPMDGYRIVAWLGWLGNLVVAEWIIRRRFSTAPVRSMRND